MMSELEVTALRNDIAQQLFRLDVEDHVVQDEGSELPEERAARADLLRMAMDVLTHVLRGP